MDNHFVEMKGHFPGAFSKAGLYPAYAEGTANGTFFNILKSVTSFDVIPFTCGRSAMVAGLMASGLERMDEILVPPFLSQCVLSAISRTAFPTMTPSSRTKAVLVFHQFGFPQDIAGIEPVARDKGWMLMNDCAHTIFTRVNGRFLMEGGDFTIISLAKLYPCGLGGGFYSSRSDINEKVVNNQRNISEIQKKRADEAFEILMKINSGTFGTETAFEINGLYGYLPDLTAFPQRAYSALPSTIMDIDKDIAHRKKIWSIIKEILPDNVPVVRKNEDIIPFAVPISGDNSELEMIARKIREELFLDAPVLHFDFARNMLNPDYRKSLVIGCHEGWKEELVIKTCEMIKRVIV